MDFWEFFENSQHSNILNFHFPDEGLEASNPLAWDDKILVHPFNFVSEVNIDEEPWTKFIADVNEDEGSFKDDSVTSNLSVLHNSQICVNEGLSETSDESVSKKEFVDSNKKSRKRSREIVPMFAIKTRSDTDVLDDGYKWRKYGRKCLKSTPHPRSYYRCHNSNCGVKKKIERDPTDPGMLITTYEGQHNHSTAGQSAICYIVEQIVLNEPGSKSVIMLLNGGLGS